MDVSSQLLQNIEQFRSVERINREYNKNGFEQKIPSKTDTVSISTEGFALAQEMWSTSHVQGELETEAETEAEEKEKNLRELYKSFMYDENGRKVDDTGEDGASPTDKAVAEIEKQIKALRQELVEVYSDPDIPEAGKEATAAGIIQEIDVLTQEKAALERNAAKQASASPASSPGSSPFSFSAGSKSKK